jgi:fumarylacetoacetate (FAA) hydrolase family protein
MTAFRDALQPVLPDDAALAGRVWCPHVAGPSVVAVRDGELFDISRAFPTMRDLCETADPAAALRGTAGERIGSVDAVLANTPVEQRKGDQPWLLAPIDLQAIKAAGVTFVVSMIERVIEERARGDLSAAVAIRAEVNRLMGDDLARLKPGVGGGGAPEAGADRAGRAEPVPRGRHRPRRRDLHQGAADGRGRHRDGRGDSSELVVEQSRARGRAGGLIGGPHRRATLSDVEGRSALLLGKAKDNNASCAIGPFLPLFDAQFTLDDVRQTDGASSIARIRSVAIRRTWWCRR